MLAERDGAVAASASRLSTALAELELQAARIVELELVADRLSDRWVTSAREAAAVQRALEAATAERDRALEQLGAALADGGAGAALRALEAGGEDDVTIERTGTTHATSSASPPGVRGGGSASKPVAVAADLAPAARVRVAEDVFVGELELDVGPLDDFAGLVALEDAIAGLDATAAVSVVRFAQGRATLALKLREPVSLFDALGERCPFDLRVRESGPDRVAVDVVA